MEASSKLSGGLRISLSLALSLNARARSRLDGANRGKPIEAPRRPPLRAARLPSSCRWWRLINRGRSAAAARSQPVAPALVCLRRPSLFLALDTLASRRQWAGERARASARSLKLTSSARWLAAPELRLIASFGPHSRLAALAWPDLAGQSSLAALQSINRLAGRWLAHATGLHIDPPPSLPAKFANKAPWRAGGEGRAVSGRFSRARPEDKLAGLKDSHGHTLSSEGRS